MDFDDVVSAIQSELNDSSAGTKVLIERWVNMCHKEICGMRVWPWLIIEQSPETTIGTDDVPFALSDIAIPTTLPARNHWSIDEILDVWETTDSVNKVHRATLDRIRQMMQTTLTESGVPQFWFYSTNIRADDNEEIERSISFYPLPDADRKFVFRYSRKPLSEASGSSFALLIPDEWHHVIHNMILAKAWRQRGDDRANVCQQDYLNSLEDMKKRCAGAMLTGFNPVAAGSVTRLPQVVTV